MMARPLISNMSVMGGSATGTRSTKAIASSDGWSRLSTMLGCSRRMVPMMVTVATGPVTASRFARAASVTPYVARHQRLVRRAALAGVAVLDQRHGGVVAGDVPPAG